MYITTFNIFLVEKATVLRTSTFSSPSLPFCLVNDWKNAHGKITNTARKKKVLRIIKNAPFRSHTASLFKKHEMLIVHNVMNEKVGLVV